MCICVRVRARMHTDLQRHTKTYVGLLSTQNRNGEKRIKFTVLHDLNPSRLEFIYMRVYVKNKFVPHREKSSLPLERSVAECYMRFTVRIILNIQTHCVGKTHVFAY
jgi:hypothetical protein